MCQAPLHEHLRVTPIAGECMSQSAENRRFIRHPTDIPIDVELADAVPARQEYLANISEGGLCLQSSFALEKGTLIRIRIPLVKPLFAEIVRVAWCRRAYNHFDVGVEFIERHSIFRVRMIEQVCHIEHYKRDVYAREARALTTEQAAMEWIEKFAEDFPTPRINRNE
jgi:hypothetical protein